MVTAVNVPVDAKAKDELAPKECLTCRIVGTGALAGVGIYALKASRPHAPGSVIGKRITAGVGVGMSKIFPPLSTIRTTNSCSISGFLIASVFRWMN